MVKLKTGDINIKVTYTTKEAATYLGLSLSNIYRMEKRSLLSPTKTSRGRRVYSQKDLEECLRKSQSFETSLIRETSTPYEITPGVEPYFQEDSIQIYKADFLKTNCVKEVTVDLIVTSPHIMWEFNTIPTMTK